MYEFTVLNEEQILYGLGGIKGVGKPTVETIITERSDNGNYNSLHELCKRLGLEKISRRVLEALIKSGAMDEFSVSRNVLMENLPDAIKSAEQEARNSAAGQNDMFGSISDNQEKTIIGNSLEWKEEKLLKNEKEALGLYLSGHPFHAIKDDALCFTDGTLKSIQLLERPESKEGAKKFRQPKRHIRFAGLIADIKKRGNRISIILDDDTSRIEATLFNDKFQEFKEQLKKDTIVVIEGNLRFDEFSSAWQVNVDSIRDIHQIIERNAKNLIIELSEAQKNSRIFNSLKTCLDSSESGICEISINFNNSNASARLDLGEKWSILPTKKLRDDLNNLLGRDSVKLSY